MRSSHQLTLMDGCECPPSPAAAAMKLVFSIALGTIDIYFSLDEAIRRAQSPMKGGLLCRMWKPGTGVTNESTSQKNNQL